MVPVFLTGPKITKTTERRIMQHRESLLIIMLILSLCSYSQDRKVLVIKPKKEQQNEKKQEVERKTKKVDKELLLHSVTVGFLQNDLKENGYNKLKSYMGFSGSFGQMFMLNSTPSVFNYGIDVIYASLNYKNYKLRIHEEEFVSTSQWHQAEAGIQVGGSLLLILYKDFCVKLYARYAPTFSAMYAEKKWYLCYSDYIIAGLTLNIGFIGLGGELRYGKNKYEDFSHTGEFKNIGANLYVGINF